ncbi:MAG: glycosyltransferase [Lachnospiraceae bacterium]
MIFVTVGTHEQAFNRLIECVDGLVEKGVIREEVIIQTGFSDYIPKHCRWSKLFSYQEMVRNVADARIVITHGGPSSFIMPLQIAKTPIVIPRKKKYDEHVNDHQVEFVRMMEERMKNIIVVEEMEELGKVITQYDEIVKAMPAGMKNNNAKFNAELEKIVCELFES